MKPLKKILLVEDKARDAELTLAALEEHNLANEVTVVRDGDAVCMPSGYHPNVSVPGHRITFLWMMAAHRETEDRQFGVVNVQPGFGAGGSGLEASRK